MLSCLRYLSSFVFYLRTAYAKAYEEWLFARSDKFTAWKHYENTKSLAHRLKDYNIAGSFRTWCQSHLVFLDNTVSIQSTLSTCHAAVTTVISSMKRFYDKKMIAMVLLETLKLTARSLEQHQFYKFKYFFGLQFCSRCSYGSYVLLDRTLF